MSMHVFAFVMLNTSVRSVYCSLSLSTSVFDVIVSSSCSCSVNVPFSQHFAICSRIFFYTVRKENACCIFVR